MRFTNRITGYMDQPEPAQVPAATPAAFAALPPFAAQAAATNAASSVANIYQIARAQAQQQVERRRFQREISRWN